MEYTPSKNTVNQNNSMNRNKFQKPSLTPIKNSSILNHSKADNSYLDSGKVLKT